MYGIWPRAASEPPTIRSSFVVTPECDLLDIVGVIFSATIKNYDLMAKYVQVVMRREGRISHNNPDKPRMMTVFDGVSGSK